MYRVKVERTLHFGVILFFLALLRVPYFHCADVTDLSVSRRFKTSAKQHIHASRYRSNFVVSFLVVFCVAAVILGCGSSSASATFGAILLCNTLPCDVHREGGVQEVKRRIVLKPNLNCERQDTTSSDARKSVDHSDKHGGTYNESCRGEIDFMIQGLLHSTVQEHDHTRMEAV